MDALAALIPAEVLALHAFMLESTTETKEVAKKSVTTITDPSALTATFWVCVALSTLLFIFGRLASKKRHWEGTDFLRMLIPPASFCLWTILQPNTAFDATWPDTFTDAMRQLIGVAGAIVVGGLAALLGLKLDNQPSGVASERTAQVASS